MKERRLCIVDDEHCYFHCWEHYSNVIDASPLVGGHPGGQISLVYGIVEKPDGKIIRVNPTNIKFCDEVSRDLYMWNEHCKAMEKEIVKLWKKKRKVKKNE